MDASRNRIFRALDGLRDQLLFVHGDVLDGVHNQAPGWVERPVYLIETLATINALVGFGALLLFGGHGGGKTTLAKLLGRVFYDKTEMQIEQGILRGHPMLTEEKILGMLRIDQLMHPRPGEKIDVIWSDFVQTQWKIIDEVNRLSPHAQNIILSLLAEGVVKYYDQSRDCGDYTLFATMNPRDAGASDLPLPFLDRFALAVPVSMPDSVTQGMLREKKPRMQAERTAGTAIFDSDPRPIRAAIQAMQIAPEADNFIDLLLAYSRLCQRVTKEHSQDLHVNNGLCRGCRYRVANQSCNKFQTPLSVRVGLDLRRYGQALAWLLGAPRVQVAHIKALAPYAIWHRVTFNRAFLTDADIYRPADDMDESGRIFGRPHRAAAAVVAEIAAKFETIQDTIATFNNAPPAGSKAFGKLNAMLDQTRQDDLFMAELHRNLANISAAENPAAEIDAAETIEEIDFLRRRIQTNYQLPFRQRWLAQLDAKATKLRQADAKTATFLIAKSQLAQVLAQVPDQALHEQIAKLFGDDLSGMRLAHSGVVWTGDHADQIELTAFHPDAAQPVQVYITIQGRLSSAFYHTLENWKD